jgi:hypothetical protein
MIALAPTEDQKNANTLKGIPNDILSEVTNVQYDAEKVFLHQILSATRLRQIYAHSFFSDVKNSNAPKACVLQIALATARK